MKNFNARRISDVVETEGPPPTGDALLTDNGEFKKFNEQDFAFAHGLAHHPLFSLKSLKELAQRIPKYTNFVYWQNGRIAVDDKWDSNPGKRQSLEETIDGIENNDSLVILKHAEQDPVFGPMLQEILQRIWSFTPASSQADIILGESLIFLNSPRRNTKYHMDLESNFLLQVRGTKHVRVFDRYDRRIIPHLEIENHYYGDHDAARYKPEFEHCAHRYELKAGQGVHFPSLAPHWVKNGDETSISININFDLVSVHQRGRDIYRINRLMRRAGMDPAPPLVSKRSDNLKVGLSRALTKMQQLRRPAADPAAGSSYPVWRPKR